MCVHEWVDGLGFFDLVFHEWVMEVVRMNCYTVWVCNFHLCCQFVLLCSVTFTSMVMQFMCAFSLCTVILCDLTSFGRDGLDFRVLGVVPHMSYCHLLN